MTLAEIRKRAAREGLPFTLALEIREVLDQALTAAELEPDERAEVETKVQELVFEH